MVARACKIYRDGQRRDEESLGYGERRNLGILSGDGGLASLWLCELGMEGEKFLWVADPLPYISVAASRSIT